MRSQIRDVDGYLASYSLPFLAKSEYFFVSYCTISSLGYSVENLPLLSGEDTGSRNLLRIMLKRMEQSTLL